jgi:protein-L-isoaspartate(D-aspartate) O-methyltransferase
MGEGRSMAGLNRAQIVLTIGAALAGLSAGCSAVGPAAHPSPSTSISRATGPSAQSSDPYAEARDRLVQDGLIGWGITDPAVLSVMGRVPRHEFVPEDYLEQAYENHPLPIGYGQTISQPYIVALMTQELQVEEGDRVLEIGTGSGYQAAVLAELGVEVYTIEIITPLEEAAGARLESLGYSGIDIRNGDGYDGWPDEAPFDGILVTAAPDHIPPPLLDQLAVGGILVIPVGPVGDYQELWKVTRIGLDQYESVSLGGVRFVPLVRAEP